MTRSRILSKGNERKRISEASKAMVASVAIKKIECMPPFLLLPPFFFFFFNGLPTSTPFASLRKASASSLQASARQNTCTRHERAREKHKRNSPRGTRRRVEKVESESFFFFGHETPTRSHTFASLSPPPFPAFSLFSTLPSFLQQTNQASEFFVSFFECRAVHRVGMMES